MSIGDHGQCIAKRCECLEQIIKNNSRYAIARIPEKFKNLRVRDFDCSVYANERDRVLAENAKLAAIAYLENYAQSGAKGEGLYLHSHTKGSGKTRLAVSIANALIDAYNEDVRFVRALDIIGKIKSCYGKDSDIDADQLIQKICEIPVLVIDDLGIGTPSDADNTIWIRIVETRSTEQRPTIVTSNLPIDKLPYDERVISKLKEQVRRVQMPEESVREYIARKKDEAFNLQLSLM